jgi:hypothetical protein
MGASFLKLELSGLFKILVKQLALVQQKICHVSLASECIVTLWMIFLLYAFPLLKLLVFKTIKACKKENNIPLEIGWVLCGRDLSGWVNGEVFLRSSMHLRNSYFMLLLLEPNST